MVLDEIFASLLHIWIESHSITVIFALEARDIKQEAHFQSVHVGRPSCFKVEMSNYAFNDSGAPASTPNYTDTCDSPWLRIQQG